MFFVWFIYFQHGVVFSGELEVNLLISHIEWLGFGSSPDLFARNP